MALSLMHSNMSSIQTINRHAFSVLVENAIIKGKEEHWKALDRIVSDSSRSS
jgi:hypothetical protein